MHNPFSARGADLRSFAAKNYQIVEATVKFYALTISVWLPNQLLILLVNVPSHFAGMTAQVIELGLFGSDLSKAGRRR